MTNNKILPTPHVPGWWDWRCGAGIGVAGSGAGGCAVVLAGWPQLGQKRPSGLNS